MANFLSMFLFAAPTADLLVWGIVCVAVGILLCCIETLIPGLGMFGICGLISFVAGEILLLVAGVNGWIVAGIFVGGAVLIIFMIALVGKSLRKGKLSKSEMFDVGTAVPTDKTEGTGDYSAYLGRRGETKTLLRPVGVVAFDGDYIDCLADGGIIEAGVNVEVIKVEGQRVVVKQV